MRNLSHNHGLIQFDLGPARIIDRYNNFIHIVNLTEHSEIIHKISNAVEYLNGRGTVSKSIPVTKLKLNELQTKLDTITPIKRKRRGLFNGLGTVVKYITGNMDDNDALEINSQIEKLKADNVFIQNTFTEQNTLNTQVTERLKNITEHINRQHEDIEKFLNNHLQIENNLINKEEQTINDLQYINLINYNIDLLHNHLSNIADSILLAKLNIISKFILSHEELEKILENFQKQQISIKSYEELYELLGLQAYYNGTNIIFNVKIPILSKEISRFLHIIPLPINNTKIIITKPYITYNNNEIRFYDKPCHSIERTYYCSEVKTKENNNESSCVGQILQNHTALCNLDDVGYFKNISLLENKFILLTNMPKTLIKSNCRNPLQEVEGTFLIHYSNCTVNINGVEYEDKPPVYWDQINMTTFSHNEIHAKLVKETLNLQKLQQFGFENKLNVLNIKRSTKSANICMFTAISILCIAVTIVFIYASKKIRIYYVSQYTQDSATAPPNSLWPSLYSKGGGVTYCTQHQLSNIDQSQHQTLPPPKPKRNNNSNNNNNYFSSNESIY